MRLLVKICGLSTPETAEAALDAGADMIGFVFHPKSPRYVSVDQAAVLARRAKGRARTVALLVDPDDTLLSQIILEVRPDVIQLHGHESPQRLQEIEERFFIPLIKAVGVATEEDIAAIRRYHSVEREGNADRKILIDAKPPKDADYPGGHGQTFDWKILRAMPGDLPFMLSGGLTPDNVADAIRQVDAMGLAFLGVDVSSGVESAPGVKDIAKIKDFIAAARGGAGPAS
jgi:phosphoribosylanthranilate isomerase